MEKRIFLFSTLALTLFSCANTEPVNTVKEKVKNSPDEILLAANDADIHKGGRYVYDQFGSAKHSWPGVYFETEFKGTQIAARLDDFGNSYNIWIDGQLHGKLDVVIGKTDYTLAEGLTNEWHSVRLIKRTVMVHKSSLFHGFLTGSNTLTRAPENRERKLVFYGDSFTVGLANESTKRDGCSNTLLHDSTNHDLAFPALVARNFDADFNSQAISGKGLIRNYAGNDVQWGAMRKFEDSVLVNEGDTDWTYPDKVDLVVVNLGINDLSTPIKSSESYTSQEAFNALYKQQYHKFLQKMRSKYGQDTPFILTAMYLWPDDLMRPLVQEIVNEEQSSGKPVYYIDQTGIELSSCQWHPSLSEHEIIAKGISNKIDELLDWQQLLY
ncbi:MAG: hypothetical protein GY951_00205 [Psychromonas sp.]|nr:hypothetical protein [Alteromonadales bacterium]MCP5076473.1 hypothetical protein [Psychromonas sp.]